jgi:hypothetical protein
MCDKISPRIKSIATRRGFDNIEVRIGGHRVLIQVSMTRISVNVGEKRIAINQDLNCADISVIDP